MFSERNIIVVVIDSFFSGLIIGGSIDLSHYLLTIRSPTAVNLFFPAPTRCIAPLIASAYFVSTFSSSTLEMSRRKDDNLNVLVGFGSTATFFHYVTSSHRRVRTLNFLVGGMLISGIFYANVGFQKGEEKRSLS